MPTDPMIAAVVAYQDDVIRHTPRRRAKLSSRELQAFLAGYRAGVANALDAKLMREVLALCHPDRHQGREERASAVMKALLELRDEGAVDAR